MIRNPNALFDYRVREEGGQAVEKTTVARRHIASRGCGNSSYNPVGCCRGKNLGVDKFRKRNSKILAALVGTNAANHQITVF